MCIDKSPVGTTELKINNKQILEFNRPYGAHGIGIQLPPDTEETVSKLIGKTLGVGNKSCLADWVQKI